VTPTTSELRAAPARGLATRKRPVVGPYAEAWRDDETGCYRFRLNDLGRGVVADWLDRYPHPVASLKSCWPKLYRVCRDAGLNDDELDALALEGVVRAFCRFDPARGARVETVIPWGVRGAVTRALAGRQKAALEHPASQGGDDSWDCYEQTPDRSPRPGAALELWDAIGSAGLSRRQRQVLDACDVGGWNQRRAASELGVTHQAVCTYRRAVARKLRGVFPPPATRPQPARLGRGEREARHRAGVLRALDGAPHGLAMFHLKRSVGAGEAILGRVLAGLVGDGLVTRRAVARDGMPGRCRVVTVYGLARPGERVA